MSEISQRSDEDNTPNTVSPPDRRLRLADLPRDMREELFNEHATNLNPEATERGFYAKTVPCGLLYVKGLTVDKIPSDQLARYKAAKLPDLPPIVISDGRLIDGQHRILMARARGILQLRYIDMTGLIDTNVGGYVSEIPIKLLRAEDPVSSPHEIWARDLPRAGHEVDGRTVREFIPNRSSIDASIGNNEVLGGVRVVPLSAFDYQPGVPDQRVLDLASQIKVSGEINPLIVGVDAKGPYIIEGGHRLDALIHLEAKDLPALVVLDMDELAPDSVAHSVETGGSLIAKNKAIQPREDVENAPKKPVAAVRSAHRPR